MSTDAESLFSSKYLQRSHHTFALAKLLPPLPSVCFEVKGLYMQTTPSPHTTHKFSRE